MEAQPAAAREAGSAEFGRLMQTLAEAWSRQDMWFEVAVVASLFAVGNIVFGHFEEGTPKWRRVLKFVVVTALGVWISLRFGRVWFWALLAGMAIPVVFIHVWWLPRRGINGWTGEPREKYYALRGWRLTRPTEEHVGARPAR